jgi:hypothetical protein
MKKVRLMSGIGIFFFLSLLGYIRDRYLIDMNSSSGLIIMGRSGEERYWMPVSIDDVSRSISENPKWISSIAYSIFYMGLSALCIGFFFYSKSKVYVALGLHVIIFSLAGILILAGLVFHSFHIAYQVAEYLKNLIQSPLLTLILIAGFLLKGN